MATIGEYCRVQVAAGKRTTTVQTEHKHNVSQNGVISLYDKQ